MAEMGLELRFKALKRSQAVGVKEKGPSLLVSFLKTTQLSGVPSNPLHG